MIVVARYSYNQALSSNKVNSQPGEAANDRLNILVLGTDNLAGSGSADTILLVSVDARTGQIGFVHPRDTRVWLRRKTVGIGERCLCLRRA